MCKHLKKKLLNFTLCCHQEWCWLWHS